MISLAPIILFCYNRPWHVEQTLVALSRNELANKSILYIYCDGPKADASEEQYQKIKEVHDVVRKHQWCKEVHVVEAEKNKGLAKSVIHGVTEIVEKYASAANEIVEKYVEMNVAHPFREGNGRTQRIYFTQLIRHYGYDINFADVDTDELMIATIQASSGVMDFLVEFFENSIILPD